MFRANPDFTTALFGSSFGVAEKAARGGEGGWAPRQPQPRGAILGPQIRGERFRMNGAWGRIRTTDTRIFNPLLYQLSYPGKGPPTREPRL